MNTQKNKKHFLRSIVTLLTGTTLAQAIPIAISPILTRIYTPEDFGVLALYLSITSIIAVIINARYELAIMLPKEDKDAVNIAALSILISSGISLVILFIVILYGKGISSLLGNKQIYPWLFFIPFSVFLTGIYQSFNYWSNRKQQYRRLAVNRVAQSVATAGTNIGIRAVKEGATGLILGDIIAKFVATMRLSITSVKSEKINLSSISITRMKMLAKRYDQFPKVSIWSGLLNTTSIQLPIFILSSFFSSTIVGWYSLSHRVMSMPMSVLGRSVGQVFFETSSKLKHEDPIKLQEITFKTYKNMLIIGLIPISLVFSFGDFLFAFVFGPEWNIAGKYARILSVWLLLVFVSSPLSLLFTVMEKEGVSFFFNLVIFISRLVSLLIGAIIFKDALIAIILFAVSGVIFWLWHCVYILKLAGITYWRSTFGTISIISMVLSVSLIIRFLFIGNVW